MDKLLEEAEKANEVLRFVGAVDVTSGKASVKLDRYPKVQCWIGMDSKPLKYITYWYMISNYSYTLLYILNIMLLIHYDTIFWGDA